MDVLLKTIAELTHKRTKASSKKEELGKARILVIGIVMVAAIVSGWVWYWVGTAESVTGEFGDRFGPLTALFSGLAFAGVIITVLLQSQELKLQRRELTETREVMKFQSRNFQKQLRDETYYQQLRIHLDNISSLSVNEESQTLVGRDALQAIYNQFSRQFSAAWSSKERQTENEGTTDLEWKTEAFQSSFDRTIWQRLSNIIQTFDSLTGRLYNADLLTTPLAYLPDKLDFEEAEYKEFLWSQCSTVERRIYLMYAISDNADMNSFVRFTKFGVHRELSNLAIESRLEDFVWMRYIDMHAENLLFIAPEDILSGTQRSS